MKRREKGGINPDSLKRNRIFGQKPGELLHLTWMEQNQQMQIERKTRPLWRGKNNSFFSVPVYLPSYFSTAYISLPCQRLHFSRRKSLFNLSPAAKENSRSRAEGQDRYSLSVPTKSKGHQGGGDWNSPVVMRPLAKHAKAWKKILYPRQTFRAKPFDDSLPEEDGRASFKKNDDDVQRIC